MLTDMPGEEPFYCVFSSAQVAAVLRLFDAVDSQVAALAMAHFMPGQLATNRMVRVNAL